MADERRIGLEEVARHFEELEDPRSSVNRTHPLVSVVVIAIMAVLAGANGPTAIAKWAALKEEFLVEALDLPEGVPGKDVFRRVLMALRPGPGRSHHVGRSAITAMCDSFSSSGRPLEGRIAVGNDRSCPRLPRLASRTTSPI